MIPAGLVRRLAALEVMCPPPEAAPPKGISALLAWAKTHPPPEDPDPTYPLTGMARLLAEATDFMKGHDCG